MTGKLRTGITTGACAAAAAKAAVLTCYAKEPKHVHVKNLQGEQISVSIERVSLISNSMAKEATAVVIKDGGDDPDVTHGLPIVAKVRILSETREIEVVGGCGVGRVTKPGLQLEVGAWAINPVPLEMIKRAIQEVLPEGMGACITIEVPGGEAIATKTLNPKLGIIGGISILGTTGIVRPMSQEAFQDSLVPQLGLVKAQGYKTVILTPGNMGERFAQQYSLPQGAVVQMSNFVGFMLQACVDSGIKQVLLWGHHGKLVKVAGGSFNTHSKIADGRREIIAAYTAFLGGQSDLVQTILDSNTAEETLAILDSAGLLEPVFNKLAEIVSSKAESYVNQQLRIGTALLSLKGDILAVDRVGRQLGSELGWNL